MRIRGRLQTTRSVFMGRKILFITTDQMRYDALGCNGGHVARTPVLDGLAASGIRYTRAHNQNVVCMPARATMLTGQYVRTHGVWMNGVPLPIDAPSVAAYLHDQAGYRTALIGKAHFEPFLDFQLNFYENRMAGLGEHGPHRGFEHMALATHTGRGLLHYSRWLAEHHPEALDYFYPVLNTKFQVNGDGGGDTGACQVKRNPIPREWYHTDWVADRTIAWLAALPDTVDWFVWMSFPDPHHPWDPPQSELQRHNWRELDAPPGYPSSREQAAAILRQKPRHWMAWYDGSLVTNYEAPPDFVPAHMTRDQVREINALAHIENELIDEACGRVLHYLTQRGWANDTDILFSTDHGELQGDFGLLFKGPCHVDALMRLPLIWRPAPSTQLSPAVVDAPVGQIDFAPTFCQIAQLAVPEWMQGQALPVSSTDATTQRRERVMTEWDSELNGVSLHLRTIYRDGFTCTVYEQSSLYDGTEGELYDHANDPQQWRNLWDEPRYRSLKSDLVADLYDHLPPARPDKLSWVTSV
jgi:arylsulfatase A-like enzyme